MHFEPSVKHEPSCLQASAKTALGCTDFGQGRLSNWGIQLVRMGGGLKLSVWTAATRITELLDHLLEAQRVPGAPSYCFKLHEGLQLGNVSKLETEGV